MAPPQSDAHSQPVDMKTKLSDLIKSMPREPGQPARPTPFPNFNSPTPIEDTKKQTSAAPKSTSITATEEQPTQRYRPALGPTGNLAPSTPPKAESRTHGSPRKSPNRPILLKTASNDAAKNNTTPPRVRPQIPKSASPSLAEQRPLRQAMARPQAQPVFAPNEPWKHRTELTVVLGNLPASFGTQRVHQVFLDLKENPVYIQVAPGLGRHQGSKKRSLAPGTAEVRLVPPPMNAAWVRNGIIVPLNTADGTKEHHINCIPKPENTGNLSFSKAQPRVPDQTTAAGAFIEFGVMKGQERLLVMHTLRSHQHPAMSLTVDVKRQSLEMRFGRDMLNEDNVVTVSENKFKVPFSEIREIVEHCNAAGLVSFVISLAAPPSAFCKVSQSEILETHDETSDTWDDWRAWTRQVWIEHRPRKAEQKTRKTKLRNDELEIDVGRWLVYRFVFDMSTSKGVINDMRKALADHNVAVFQKTVLSENKSVPTMWRWLEDASGSSQLVASSALLSGMSETVQLSFQVQYQLEVCISRGNLHECNIDVAFIRKLNDMETPRATKLLEKVAEQKKRYFKPMDIFRLQSQISSATKKPPSYCTMIRSATVTPTTIVFNSPSVDTSNRIIRQYKQHEDRFLRVKFRDESYKGMIMAFDDGSTLDLFDRVHYTMVNGIVVGGRHYEFLAFGNSQFREHGAYFFAPVSGLTASDIRRAMGNFEHIQVVAKYASRIGQCFSTTRAMPNAVKVERIDDIERNGHCFTDGVGKISQALAQMTAQEMGILSSAEDCPSVYQFRMGGCKGVLTIDPALKGSLKVVIRPSQEKFPTRSTGFEICRISQFATAYLNQQIVLVLSALGVPDNAFLVKLRKMLSNLEEAMTDQAMALELLQKNIDLNQTAVTIAEMILHGFMAAKDPFTLSLLRLWRSWSIKYLKEKAKIFVDQGAFVLGVVDETSTLKGYTRDMPVSDSTVHDAASLPEIFIQIPDPDHEGKFKVITGVCTIARNPSLHPGDIRVVNAVDAPALRHLRNCLVLPQTGDRDLASMCSGGDLDGDDYLVMWDKDLFPSEWNHEPMDYTAPPPKLAKGPVTVEHMTKFFVQHMRYDTLGRIAVAHRYWADRMEDGVKDEKCVQLAELHSKAVDYAKTGVPAEMPKELKVTQRPHWADNKPGSNTYRSKRVLGKLYDEVDRVPFVPAWDAPFDHRVLYAFELDDAVLEKAKEIKGQYDEAIRRIMAQHGIKSEFEVWSTFVLDHNHESRDFKIAEELGSTVESLKLQFKELCYVEAGTTSQARDEAKLHPFVAAMYTVTAREVETANRQCEKRKLVAGQYVPGRRQDHGTMPLISFPWLFQKEMGRIATKKQKSITGDLAFRFPPLAGKKQGKNPVDAQGNAIVLPELDEVETIKRDSDQLDEATPSAETQASLKATELEAINAGTTNAGTTNAEKTVPDKTEEAAWEPPAYVSYGSRFARPRAFVPSIDFNDYTPPPQSQASTFDAFALFTKKEAPAVPAPIEKPEQSRTAPAAPLRRDFAPSASAPAVPSRDESSASTTAPYNPLDAFDLAVMEEDLKRAIQQHMQQVPQPSSSSVPPPGASPAANPPASPTNPRSYMLSPSCEEKTNTDKMTATPGDRASLMASMAATDKPASKKIVANVIPDQDPVSRQKDDGHIDEEDETVEEVKLEMCGTGVDALDRLAALLG